MNHFFVDTNIWLDWYMMREGNEEAWLLIDAAESTKCKLFTSAISVSTITYILRREAKVKTILQNLLKVAEIIDSKKSSLLLALSSDFKDIEDAYQYFTAISESKIDAIVTNNLKDFKNSAISVMNAKAALKLL